MTNGLTFDHRQQGGTALDIARHVVLARLRADRDWTEWPHHANDFSRWVNCSTSGDCERFLMLVHDVMWEFIVSGVIAPGLNARNPHLPFFHLTDYGREVVAAEQFVPHDPSAYLKDLSDAIPNIDATVLAYVTQSLQCYLRNLNVPSAIMLGIAAERVFLLVCDALQLQSDKERVKFAELLRRNAMKPKLDFVLHKLSQVKTPDLPDNLNVTFAAIYDFIRQQRNEVGHPRPLPPAVTREQAFGYLRMLPGYYRAAQTLITYMKANPL
jgi:hypothetical protein